MEEVTLYGKHQGKFHIISPYLHMGILFGVNLVSNEIMSV